MIAAVLAWTAALIPPRIQITTNIPKTAICLVASSR